MHEKDKKKKKLCRRQIGLTNIHNILKSLQCSALIHRGNKSRGDIKDRGQIILSTSRRNENFI